MIHLYDPDIGLDEREAIEAVLDSGQLADGPEVRAFESSFASTCDATEAVATMNGTTALHAALEALGVGEGDVVITTPLSFVASANAARLAGAEVRFADVDPETLLLDPEDVERVASDCDGDVAAVVAVHLYGLPAAMDALGGVCDRYGAALVEDAAQAHGARHEGRPVGAIGDVGCFSFYPTKNMTTGEGGMIVTDRDPVAKAARRFVNHGRTGDGSHASLGHNFRMTSMAGALGRVQLEKLPEYTDRRRHNAARLSEELADLPLVLPPEPPGRRHAYHQYVVRADDRAGLRQHLKDRDVQTGVYYPRCIHQEPAYSGVRPSVPNAERATDRLLSLPVHPNLSTEELKYVADAIREYYDEPTA